MDSKGKIVFVTGTSGTGKSTLAVFLRKSNFKNVKVYDMDECGVPDDVDEQWRKDRTEELLDESTQNIKNGCTSIICGVSVPEEVKMSKSYSRNIDIVFGILEISELEIINRLRKRRWSEEQITANVNWARYLHECISKENNNFFINSEKYSPLEVVNKVLKIIGIRNNKELNSIL
jgi:broad-specificity NMP kinase